MDASQGNRLQPPVEVDASSHAVHGLHLVPGSGHDRSGGQATPRVAILMCTYNGEQFLGEQLSSIEQQSHANWTLHVSDDGSSDGTRRLLQQFQARWGADKVTIRSGPKAGFVANFLSLTCDPAIQADCYAYADQDDIWAADKLSRALHWLQGRPQDAAALYCSRTRLIDQGGQEIGFSPLFKKPPSFRNAIVQSIAGANTMVFNNAARGLMLATGNIAVVSHDWWAYMVVSGCGGEVLYDPEPGISYRQHGGNLVGANTGLVARIKRIMAFTQGRFTSWNETNLAALAKLESNLAPANKATLRKFMNLRKAGLVPRVVGVAKSGIYRQTMAGTLSLFMAAALRKI